MNTVEKSGSVAAVLLATVLLAGALENVVDPRSIIQIAISLMLSIMGFQ